MIYFLLIYCVLNRPTMAQINSATSKAAQDQQGNFYIDLFHISYAF